LITKNWSENFHL